ncbi:YciI family protein [Streptomyces sp. SM11]|uniref:YciI family protein n=1 Tax=Streptomyces sp. SM11 TaxID=565557 RepID=UPI000CD59851|nr:YciI family protein [Streptomyces sp. SM11]
MPFYVHAQDKPDVADQLDELSEEHWSYMDRFADRLIIRGPTLSDDGEEHTGSVHVVDLTDRTAAERFATEEPFWKAGLYREFMAAPVVVLLPREPVAGVLYTLVTARWSPRTHTPGDTEQWLAAADPDGRPSFVAALVDDGRDRTTGLVAAVRALPDEARSLVQPLADRLAGGPVSLTSQRWQRGGRD